MKLEGKTLKTVGIVATVAGIGVSLISGWVQNQQVDEMISEKVSEEVTKQMKMNNINNTEV